jgi:hypothetical protein
LNTISSISWRPRRRRRLLIDDSLPLGQLPPLHRSEFEEGVTTVYHHGAKAEELQKWNLNEPLGANFDQLTAATEYASTPNVAARQAAIKYINVHKAQKTSSIFNHGIL